jgi:hypothetical protein
MATSVPKPARVCRPSQKAAPPASRAATAAKKAQNGDSSSANSQDQGNQGSKSYVVQKGVGAVPGRDADVAPLDGPPKQKGWRWLHTLPVGLDHVRGIAVCTLRVCMCVLVLLVQMRVFVHGCVLVFVCFFFWLCKSSAIMWQ